MSEREDSLRRTGRKAGMTDEAIDSVINADPDQHDVLILWLHIPGGDRTVEPVVAGRELVAMLNEERRANGGPLDDITVDTAFWSRYQRRYADGGEREEVVDGEY